MIAVFAPGGSVDRVARILAQQLTLQTRQQVIVENRGGAFGSIGTAELANSTSCSYARLTPANAASRRWSPSMSCPPEPDLAAGGC